MLGRIYVIGGVDYPAHTSIQPYESNLATWIKQFRGVDVSWYDNVHQWRRLRTMVFTGQLVFDLIPGAKRLPCAECEEDFYPSIEHRTFCPECRHAVTTV